jgi:ATP-dependent DNA ligase
MPPVAPMLAKSVAEIPPDRFYEPKWDGFRAIVFRDGDEVEIGSRNDRPLTRYFPEVVAAVKAQLPPRCVVDAEIVVAGADGRSLDFNALQLRLHPAASRVNLLAETSPAHLIVFDLLALGDTDHTGRPFRERRTALEAALRDVRPPVHLTPITTDREVAARWFEVFEGAGLDGLVAKDGAETYQPNKRVMAKVKHVRTADCVVAGYRVHKSGPDAVGSLLLGLYDDPADPVVPAAMREWTSDTTGLTPVGVIGAFPMAMRRELVTELEPLITTFEGHPWNWAAAADEVKGNYGSRWNPQKDLTFVPLRPERVVEVRYEHMEGHRFRHMAQFVRWRPDRDPRSCGFAQLDRPVRFDLAEILGGRLPDTGHLPR